MRKGRLVKERVSRVYKKEEKREGSWWGGGRGKRKES
jgi:hypothetical protein